MENSERHGNTRPSDLPLEKLYAGQEATVRTGHGPKDWFQIGKGVRQGGILSPCLFNLYAEYIQPVHRKEDQSWAFTGRTDVEAETPILWPQELTHWKRP